MSLPVALGVVVGAAVFAATARPARGEGADPVETTEPDREEIHG